MNLVQKLKQRLNHKPPQNLPRRRTPPIEMASRSFCHQSDYGRIPRVIEFPL
jgi:hypothetical protein